MLIVIHVPPNVSTRPISYASHRIVPFTCSSLQSHQCIITSSNHRKALLRSGIKSSCHVVVRMRNLRNTKGGGSKEKKQTNGAAQGRSTKIYSLAKQNSCKIHGLLASHISLPPASPKQSIALCSILASCLACPALSSSLAFHPRHPMRARQESFPHPLLSLLPSLVTPFFSNHFLEWRLAFCKKRKQMFFVRGIVL